MIGGAALTERKPTRGKSKASRKSAPAAEPEGCAHNWVIGRPDAQVSRGVCSKCGAEKDFLNYGEELRMPFGRRRRS